MPYCTNREDIALTASHNIIALTASALQARVLVKNKELAGPSATLRAL